jgi:hypothetical protein
VSTRAGPSAARIASTKPSARRGSKLSSHHIENAHTTFGAVDAGLDPTNEPVAEEDRHHVPDVLQGVAAAATGRADELELCHRFPLA